MADGFDTVSVWPNDESAVVVGVIARAQAGGSVVFAAGSERCPAKGVDLGSACRDKGDVKMSLEVHALMLSNDDGRINRSAFQGITLRFTRALL